MKEFFIELAEYNHHYNSLLINEIIRFENQLNDKTIQLMSHVLNAQHIWNARIHSSLPQLNVWQVHNTSEFLNIENQNYLDTKTIIHEGNLESIIEYKNSKGDSFENLIKDILFHIFNHSTYHRAQIATEFRNARLEPLATDYIFYKR